MLNLNGTDSVGFSNAIEVACDLIEHEFIPKVNDSGFCSRKIIQTSIIEKNIYMKQILMTGVKPIFLKKLLQTKN